MGYYYFQMSKNIKVCEIYVFNHTLGSLSSSYKCYNILKEGASKFIFSFLVDETSLS